MAADVVEDTVAAAAAVVDAAAAAGAAMAGAADTVEVEAEAGEEHRLGMSKSTGMYLTFKTQYNSCLRSIIVPELYVRLRVL